MTEPANDAARFRCSPVPDCSLVAVLRAELCVCCVVLLPAWLQSYAVSVSGMLSAWLERVGDKALTELSCTLETLCQLFPSEFPLVFGRPVLRLLHTLLAVQRYCQLSAAEQANTSSLGLPSDLVCGHYLYVLARLLFSNLAGGLSLLSDYAAQAGQPAESVLRSLLSVWLLKLDSVAELYKRKLSVMAIGRVLQEQQADGEQQSMVLEWLVACTGVQGEIDKGEDGPASDKHQLTHSLTQPLQRPSDAVRPLPSNELTDTARYHASAVLSASHSDSPPAVDGDRAHLRGTESDRRQQVSSTANQHSLTCSLTHSAQAWTQLIH